jgi:hypothetical protein
MEDVRPDVLRRPAPEPVIQRLARPIGGGSILPSPAGDEDVDDAADDTTVVNARLAPRIGWKIRLKPRELRLAQPKMVLIHPPSPFGDLESENHPRRDPLYGSGA